MLWSVRRLLEVVNLELLRGLPRAISSVHPQALELQEDLTINTSTISFKKFEYNEHYLTITKESILENVKEDEAFIIHFVFN